MPPSPPKTGTSSRAVSVAIAGGVGGASALTAAMNGRSASVAASTSAGIVTPLIAG